MIDVDLPVAERHIETGLASDWMAVQVGEHTVVVNEASEESTTAYTIEGTTTNPRVMATADAVLWDGIVGLTHFEDGRVSISHRFGGIEKKLPADVFLDDAVPVLERTDLVRLHGTGAE